jgi:hypothetical protein
MSLAHVRFHANHGVQSTGIEELDTGLPRAPAESMLRRIISSYRRALRPTLSNRCWLSANNASLSNKDPPLMPTTIIPTIHTAHVQQLVNRRGGRDSIRFWLYFSRTLRNSPLFPAKWTLIPAPPSCPVSIERHPLS